LPDVSDQTKWEPLDEHLRAVGARADEFAAAFGFAKWGEAAGLLHDIGKVSDAYLAYICGRGNSPDHSTARAIEAMRRYGEICGRLLAFTVAGHHAGLSDGKDLSVRLTKTVARYAGWENYTGMPPALSDLDPPTGFTKSAQYTGFEMAFLTRMIFSCLVDADFLETEHFYAKARGESTERGGHRPLVALRNKLRAHMEGVGQTSSGPLTALRTEILAHAVSKAVLKPGMFTMTVPTGGGKTLASMSFALEHAVAHNLRRVIYVAPYTAIIEQTAQVFRGALAANEDSHGARVRRGASFAIAAEAMMSAGKINGWGIKRYRGAIQTLLAAGLIVRKHTDGARRGDTHTNTFGVTLNL